ncbi:MAG: uracil-DNA glycosylase [Nitrososphaerales archaeon]
MNPQSEMKRLDKAILDCKLCKLWSTRTNAVPGTGKIEDVEVVFVGEGPGRNEDLEGKPFVGSGGKLLDELLNIAGLDRNLVYITNIVKCRPPKNRKPEDDEVATCTSNYLEKQIEILKPLVVCTLGATALEYFTGEKKMGVAHGKITKTKGGIVLLPTYHPAAIFRNPSYREILQADLKKIKAIISDVKKNKSEKQTSLTNY